MYMYNIYVCSSYTFPNNLLHLAESKSKCALSLKIWLLELLNFILDVSAIYELEQENENLRFISEVFDEKFVFTL